MSNSKDYYVNRARTAKAIKIAYVFQDMLKRDDFPSDLVIENLSLLERRTVEELADVVESSDGTWGIVDGLVEAAKEAVDTEADV